MYTPSVAAQNIAFNPSVGKNQLPEIGVVASQAISLDKEIQIGDILMRQLRGQAPIIRDPLLEEYIQDLGNRLVANAQNVKFPFKFFLVNNKEINAFAFFGGHVGIHTGLLYHADNESELASVLAHEISHVTQRHIARSILAKQKSSALQIASLFGGLLLAMADPEAGIAALQVSGAASAQASINYTRANEREADRIGIQAMIEAGFDPRGAATFFGKMLEQSRNRSKPLPFLLTHPLPESRVADARSRAQAMPTVRNDDSLSFHLAKARIQARYFSHPQGNIELFTQQLGQQRYVFKQAAQYGLALSYLANEELDKAQRIIDALRENAPNNLFYIDTATDLALAKAQPQRAIAMLQDHHSRTPHNQVITLNLANAAIEDSQYGLAAAVLKDFLLIHPNHYLALQLLSQAYGKSQQMLEMHQSKAELFALVGAYTRAIDELHSAYTYASERDLEKQRIRARIDQFREADTKLKTL